MEINELGGAGKANRRQSEPKIIHHQPTKVDLCKADNPWCRSTCIDRMKELSEDEQQTAELYLKFQGILNKITPQKFQTLAEQALKLDINSEERLRGCVDKIFINALTNSKFSIVYANLCKVLSPIKVEFAAEDGKIINTNFRRVLLTKLQQEFEKEKKDDTERKHVDAIKEAETEEQRKFLEAELTFKTRQMRQRSLAHIRFVGELFKLKMLSETIIHECIMRLLRSASDIKSLECCAVLIITTGKGLDHVAAKARIDTYFRRIADIVKKGKISTRTMFMLQDVQELRDRSWVPRPRQDHQLMTIDQIHAEAKLKAEEEKAMLVEGGGRDSWHSAEPDNSQTKRDRGNTKVKLDPERLKGLLKKRNKDMTPTSPGAPFWDQSYDANTVAEDTVITKLLSSSSLRQNKDGGLSGCGSTFGPKCGHMTLES